MDIDKRSVVISSIILSVIGMSGFLILPLLIGAVANSLHFNEQELGFMASSIMTAAAISSIFSIIWIRKINWKLAGYAAVLLMFVSHISALFIHHQIFFVLLMCAAAFGGGTLYSIALTVLSDSSNADRYFGYSIAAQVSFQVLGLMILPKFITQYGINSLLTLFLILEIIGLLLLRWLPRRGVERTKNTVITHNIVDINNFVNGLLKPKVVLALLGCFMFFFNVGVIWTYIERMGNSVGFSSEDIGLALSIGVFFGIPGALLAAWISQRFGHVRPLALAALLTVISVYMLIESMTFTDYIIALILYNFSWNFSLTFQYAVVNSVDTSGRGVAATPAFHAMGAAAGPAIAALYVTSSNYIAVNILAISSVIISLLFFVVANKLRKR
ncbi:MAG: MFS transporter [Gammaproteobacteria bacterium]|nr:MFS transporter [Gammaproteobacteria bacterium]